jgi:hypothetical protein
MTANGVSRFDGYKFANYMLLEDGVENSLVTNMVEDANGVCGFSSSANKVYRFDQCAKAENKSQLMRENFKAFQVADQ